MKRLFLLAGLLAFISSSSQATIGIPAPTSETQACSAGTCARSAAPTSSAEGAPLLGVRAMTVVACAAAGQTLSGAGTMQAYWCENAYSSTTCPRAKDSDLAITVSSTDCAGSACQCQVWKDIPIAQVSLGADSIVFAASGVTVSGGAALTVRIYTSNAK